MQLRYTIGNWTFERTITWREVVSSPRWALVVLAVFIATCGC